MRPDTESWTYRPRDPSPSGSGNWAVGFSWGILLLLGVLFSVVAFVVGFIVHVVRGEDQADLAGDESSVVQASRVPAE
jgi:hypothetical protein